MNNTTVNTLTEITTAHVSNTERYVIITIILIITIFVFLFNIVIAAVLLDSSKLSINTKFLTGSLCISDLCVGFILVFSLVTAFSNRWIFGDAVCVIITYGTCVVLAVTLVTLTVMMVDKTLLVNFPLRYQSVMTRQLLTLCVIGIWIACSFIIFTVAKVFNFHHEYASDIYNCSVYFTSVRDSRNALICTFVGGLGPMFGIFLFGNISIYRVSKHHHQRIRPNIKQALQTRVKFNGNSETSNIKGLMTILLSTIIRVVCWFPIFTLGVLNWSSDMDIDRLVRFTAQLLVYCNSFSSWLIYTTTHVTYRKAQNRLFAKLKSQTRKLKCSIGNGTGSS